MRPDQTPPSPSRPSWRGREAAKKVGGQRRRLTRRESLPRSRTTPVLPAPVLLPSTTAATSSTFAYNVEPRCSRQEEPKTPIERYMHELGIPYKPEVIHEPEVTNEHEERKMDFFPIFGTEVRNEAHSSPKPQKSKLTSRSTPSKNDTRKAGEDGSHQQQHLGNQVGAPKSVEHTSVLRLPTSPLPPGTPSKAAQVLGLDPDKIDIDNSQVNKPMDEYHKAQHSSSVWAHFNVFKQTQLTTTKNTSFRQIRFREEGVESIQPKSKKFPWGFSGKKITKKSQRQNSTPNLDYYQYHHQQVPIPHPSAPPPPPPPPSDPPSPASNDHVDTPVTYEFVQGPPSQHQPSDRFTPSQRVSSRHMRRKGPRSLDRMTPITEVSHDELHSAYRDSDHMPELDVISEYEDNYPPRKSSKMTRSQTVAVLPDMGREIYEDDVDDWGNDESEDEEEGYMAHPGSQVDIPRIMIADLNRLKIKSPLQKMEGALLDENEKKLQERQLVVVQDTLQSSRAAEVAKVHETVSELKVWHERMKREFYAYRDGTPTSQSPVAYKEESDDTDDTDDLVSICSSIDLDEEPVVCEAKTKDVIKIRPGQVKLIDIPPRRKQNAEDADSIITTGYRRENVSPATPRAISDGVSTDAQTEHNCDTQEKRAKMPREESQLLTRNWILRSPRPADQQPISMCFDADLLADQQIPPAPVLKDLMPASPLSQIPKDTLGKPPLSPPPKSAARKLQQQQQHMCVRDGHLFCRLDLRKSVGNRQLNLSKYYPQPLRWEAQKEQYGEATLCDKCNITVHDEIHECEIPVCRLAVCSKCALDMERGWREGAIKSWGYSEWSYKSLLGSGPE